MRSSSRCRTSLRRPHPRCPERLNFVSQELPVEPPLLQNDKNCGLSPRPNDLPGRVNVERGSSRRIAAAPAIDLCGIYSAKLFELFAAPAEAIAKEIGCSPDFARHEVAGDVQKPCRSLERRRGDTVRREKVG